MDVKCKICCQNSSLHASSLILKKYSINYYYYCQNCGFLQTEEPYWLNEAYSKAIAAADTGILVRNLGNANNLLFFMKCLPADGGGGGEFATATKEEKEKAFLQLRELVLKLDQEKLVENFTELFYGYTFDFESYNERLCLSWDMIREMANSGYCTWELHR